MAGKLLATTVAEFGLGIQAWWGATHYDPRLVAQVAWPNQPREKPHDGGFFTSSRRGYTSAWIDYQAKTPRATESRTTYFLQPDPSAVLCVIDSPDDYDRLVETYPQRYDNRNDPRVCPHWKRLAVEGHFDAIHMTAVATEHDCRYAHSWAVESTLWLRPKLTLLDQV